MMETTKQLTNEMVFERLGWVKSKYLWHLPDGSTVGHAVSPDPLHDLNATFKYVWPEFKQTYIKWHGKGLFDVKVLRIMDREDKALAICQAVMDLPEEGR